MNYKRLHDGIIERAKVRIKPEEYSEKHHIVPRCIGGTNEQSNLVNLTAREHFIIHYLLTKIYPDNSKLLRAWAALSCWKPHRSKRSININSRFYKIAREKFSQVHSSRLVTEETRKRIGLSRLGRKHSKKSKQAISKSLLGNTFASGNKGKPKSRKHRNNIKKALTGKKHTKKRIKANSEAQKKYWKTHTRTLSKEIKLKMSKAAKLRWKKQKSYQNGHI